MPRLGCRKQVQADPLTSQGSHTAAHGFTLHRAVFLRSTSMHLNHLLLEIFIGTSSQEYVHNSFASHERHLLRSSSLLRRFIMTSSSVIYNQHPSPRPQLLPHPLPLPRPYPAAVGGYRPGERVMQLRPRREQGGEGARRGGEEEGEEVRRGGSDRL
eukprot:765504-Hanusia_phi.AAC.13